MDETRRLTLLADEWQIEADGTGRQAAERGASCPIVPLPAARQSMWRLIVTLLVVIIAQIYTLTLSSIVRSLDADARELKTVERELRQMAESKIHDTTVTFWTAYNQFGVVQQRLQASSVMLSHMARPWSWIFAPAEGELLAVQGDETAHRAIRELNTAEGARVILEALSVYLLPLLYGFLGANAFVLRALGQPSGAASSPVLTRDHIRLRLALGALLGATVGLFFSADTPVVGTALSLVSVAFLAGYSVEFFFAVFDFFIAKVRDTLSAANTAKPAAISRRHGRPERPTSTMIEAPAAR
jgi:hypothetical protein